VNVKKGVLKEECGKLLKDFFVELRVRNKAEKEQKGNL
jgi:tRNA(adenine34) deaminase